MCVAVPMKVKELRGEEALVELDGFEKEVYMMLVDEINIGDYVMVHAGFAIQKVNPEEAASTLEALKELGEKIQDMG